MKKKFFIYRDTVLVCLLAVSLALHYSGLVPLDVDSALMVILAGLGTLPVILSALRALKAKSISIDLLASIALIVSLLAQEWTSAVFINMMLASARLFARYTDSRARRAIASLLKLKPKTAKINENGELKEIPLEQIKKGDSVVVELGERIPVDGTIIKGEASVDQSSLTGESLPVSKSVGEIVLSSTIVTDGNIVVRAEKIGPETTLERIIELVEKSQQNKAAIHGISERFTRWYIFITIAGAIILYFFSANLDLVLSVLLVTCADDIAVAIPLAFLAAIGYAAKRGIIIKGNNILEGLSKLKVVVVDKTGTLTRGRLKVEEFFTFNGVDPDEALQLAGAVCVLSSHPSAKAVIEYVKENHIVPSEPQDFHEHSGKGAQALWHNKKILSGKLQFFQEQNVQITDAQMAQITEAKNRGFNITLFAADGKMICFTALADELRPQTKQAITELKATGIEKIVMLTGDNEKIARRVASQAGISEFHANLLPEDKIRYLKTYLNKKYKVAMIGDGVNDAAVLALADIGIAMGAIGSDVAIETADIALMKDDLTKVPEIIKLSKYSVSVARQNFWIWGLVNVLGLVLVFFGFFPPARAAAYNFITDFIPLLNSMKLFRLHLKK
ncbi:MAG: cation-translocating P-type ATPase [bacterium]